MAIRPTRGRGVAAVVVLALVTLLFFSGLLTGRTYSEVSLYERVVYPWGSPAESVGSPRIIHYDQAKSYYPWQVFINRSLRSGQVPLWDPYSFAGIPFLAANANNVLYPPRMALSVIADPSRVHDVLVSTHMFLAGVAMYLLLVYFGASFASALLGAISWMASSFMLAWLALEHFVTIAALLPLALLLVDMAIRRRSWPATLSLGLVLAVLFLGGNILFVELCFCALALYGAFLVATAVADAMRHRQVGRRRRELGVDGARFVLPWVICGGISAVTLLPTLELIHASGRAPLSYSTLQTFRLPISELVNFVVAPRLNSSSFLKDPYHAALFEGTAVAVLACIGFASRRRGAWFARVLGLFTLLVVLGTPALALPYFTLPGFDSFKPLGRALFLFAFAVAILAALGLDAIFAFARRRLSTRSAGVCVVAVSIAAIGSTVGQLRVYAGKILHTQKLSSASLYPVTPLVDRLERDPGARFFPTESVLPGSTPLVYPIENALGYESIVPRRVQDFWRIVSGLPPRDLAAQPIQSAFELTPTLDQVRIDLLRKAGVNYVVTAPSAPGARRFRGQLTAIYTGRDGTILRVDHALPRAYVVSSCERASDSRSALSLFQQPHFDSRRTVVLEGDAIETFGAECNGTKAPMAGSAQVVREGINGVTVEVYARRPAFLVLNDSWDAGWEAMVDGRQSRVLPANSVFRAVPVPAGRHRVVFRYLPSSYEAGRRVTRVTLILTLGALTAIGVRRWKRRGAHDQSLEGQPRAPITSR